MANGGELAADGAAVELIGKELLNEVADISAAGAGEERLAGFEEFSELSEVAGVGGDGQLGQSALDLEIVEKAAKEWGRCRALNSVSDAWILAVFTSWYRRPLTSGLLE